MRESLCSIGHSPAQYAQLTLTPDAAWDRDVGLGCASCVAMMQPGPGPMIVLEVLPQDAPQVLLCDNDDVVEAVQPITVSGFTMIRAFCQPSINRRRSESPGPKIPA